MSQSPFSHLKQLVLSRGSALWDPIIPQANFGLEIQKCLFIAITTSVSFSIIIFPMVVVDENPYYYAAIGGIILGIATSLNYCLRGKVTGMSGILYGIFTLHKQEIPEKISIVGGMLLASGIFFDIFQYGTYNNFTPFGSASTITASTSYIGYGLAGLLVGFGTKLANGCTSGHGLCGLPRLSSRSIVAVIVFLTCGLGISTIRYHFTLGALSDQSLNPKFEYNHLASANVCIVVGMLLPFLGGYLRKYLVHHQMNFWEVLVDQTTTFLTGFLFGLGLLVSGMVRRSNILGFLGLGENWNPSLMFVLGCGVLVNLLTFNYMLKVKKYSYLGHELFNPSNSTIDWKLILGAACFGFGWGIGGLCPGPTIMQFSVFSIPIHLIWFGCLVIGMLIARGIEHYITEKNKKVGEQQEKAASAAKLGHPHMHSLHHKHHVHLEPIKRPEHMESHSLDKINFTKHQESHAALQLVIKPQDQNGIQNHENLNIKSSQNETAVSLEILFTRQQLNSQARAAKQ